MLQSVPHKGTSFTLYFPVQAEKFVSNTPKTNNIKCCFLDLSPEIEKLVRPLFILSGWHICENLEGNCLQVSHEPNADICIPKTYTPTASIQHPCALCQIWDAIQLKD